MEENKITENSEKNSKKVKGVMLTKTSSVTTAIEAAFNKVGVWKLDVKEDDDSDYSQDGQAD